MMVLTTVSLNVMTYFWSRAPDESVVFAFARRHITQQNAKYRNVNEKYPIVIKLDIIDK